MDVAGRARRLQRALDDLGCDALLVTHLTNIRYLTGFTGSAALLVVLPGELVFVTDGRYEQQAGGELGDAGVEATLVVGRTLEAQRTAIVEALADVERIGLEAERSEERRVGKEGVSTWRYRG